MKRACILFVALAACGGSSEGSGADVDSGAAPGPAQGADAAPRDAGREDDAASPVASDAAVDASASCDAGGCASVAGFVVRTSTKPTHGGKGPIYVAIFDGNPILDASHAVVVARSLLPSTDLSADGAKAAYRIDAVPVRAAAYQVIAFLDDANAVSASNPQPAPGDLVSLTLGGAIGGVPLTVAASGDVHLDLPLNAALP